jgi:hypothetical protein
MPCQRDAGSTLKHIQQPALSFLGASTEHFRAGEITKQFLATNRVLRLHLERITISARHEYVPQLRRSDIVIACNPKRPKAPAGRHIHFHVAPMELRDSGFHYYKYFAPLGLKNQEPGLEFAVETLSNPDLFF